MSPEHDDPALTVAETVIRAREQERFLPGTVLAQRYRIIALAGRGGMGEVYRADDLKLGQPVALKFLPPAFERDPAQLQRLSGEVRVARQVSHPNVCRVYDVVESDGVHFITMEYVDGEDLAALLRRIGRLPQEKALDLARQIGTGLAAAHAQGIVHRDLKPANIMLDGRGRARITDFGIASAAEAVRGAEAHWGTPAYMAPEQLVGGDITARTDLYALGLVFYEMFTGHRAIEGSPAPVAGARAGEPPALPSSFVHGLDPAIDAAILQCLESDPARRPASAARLLALLPGGDPLEAAVRAGETPSPEMVAAAGEEGSLSAPRAWGLFGLTIAAALAAIVVGARITGLDRVPLTRGPEILCDRAAGIAHQLGGDAAPRDAAWWFDLDDGYADWSARQSHAPLVGDARPSAFRFHYRQSPRPIVPGFLLRLTRHEPAPSWSGESYVALDPQGALLGFSRLDRQLPPADSARTTPVDWGPLLALTGADRDSLRAVAPLWMPDVPSDTRAAWITDTGGTPVRIEAAAWRGKPVWLRTIAPWTRPERDSPRAPRGYTGLGFFVAAVILSMLTIAVLARHNLRLGRGDRRGALRIGTAVFVCFGISASLIQRWSIDPLHVWVWIWAQPYFPALCAWLTYLGVEPFLRRRWPHRLIAWTRLLDGRFADPLVGREVLLGLLAGAGGVLVSGVAVALARQQEVDLLVAKLPLGRGLDFWAGIPDSIGDGLMKGLGALAMLLILRVLLRRDSAAYVGLGVLWALIALPSWRISVIEWLGIAAMAGSFLLAVRVGIVAAVVATVSANLLTYCTPLTVDFSRWYAWRTGVIAVLLFALAAWGFRAVMSRRRILSAAAFDRS